MSKALKRSLSLLLALTMALGIMVIPIVPDAAAAQEGVSRSLFSGRLGEWDRVPHNSVEVNNLTLRVTSDGDVLYTIVEGSHRDTRNVYYISIAGKDGGFTRLGRPNVHFIVANGWLYSATADQATNATPEWLGTTVTRLSRISMEYHGTWTGMVLRLDQIGGPNPGDISISWQGFDATIRSTTAAHLPANTGALLSVTQSYSRLQEDGSYYPAEDYSVILNPLVGGGSSMSASGATSAGQVMGYAYVSWRSLQPNRGEIDLDVARIYSWNDYPVLGPDRNQWGSRAPLLNDLMRAYGHL